jgi:hypothetical protein
MVWLRAFLQAGLTALWGGLSGPTDWPAKRVGA